jgi:hypothetical protein
LHLQERLESIEKEMTAEQQEIVAKLDALKRLQAEKPVNRNTGQVTTELDALLPAILQSSPGFDPTGDRAFKGEL